MAHLSAVSSVDRALARRDHLHLRGTQVRNAREKAAAADSSALHALSAFARVQNGELSAFEKMRREAYLGS